MVNFPTHNKQAFMSTFVGSHFHIKDPISASNNWEHPLDQETILFEGFFVFMFWFCKSGPKHAQYYCLGNQTVNLWQSLDVISQSNWLIPGVVSRVDCSVKSKRKRTKSALGTRLQVDSCLFVWVLWAVVGGLIFVTSIARVAIDSGAIWNTDRGVSWKTE